MQFNMLCNIIPTIVLWVFVTVVHAVHDGGYTLDLEHAIGQSEFRKRGELHFSNLKGEKVIVQNQAPLTERDLAELTQASKLNDLYRIRMRTKLQEMPGDNSSWVSSFTHAKSILSSHLCDHIHIHTDGNGNIISISVVALNNNAASSQYDLDPDMDLLVFDTSVDASTPEQAPVPDTHGYLNKLEEEKRKKEIQAKEPQSFFGKYWMFIVPVVLFVMMSNSAQQQ